MKPGRTSFYIAAILFLLPIANLMAQQGTAGIHGKIQATDNRPASYVTVALKGIGIVTEADVNGNFSFMHLPSLKDTLVIYGVGFVSYQQVIRLDNNQQTELGIILLYYAVNQLQNVEITGRIARSFKSDYSFAATKTQTAVKDIPQAVSSVTKELINDKMQLHLTNALENVPGITHYSGYEEYNIRGLHAENARLINGLRTFNTSLTSPLLVNIERVEVLKGPTSVLYGNCDPGGTINLVTKKPLRTKQYSLIAGAGSWDAYNLQADATGPLNRRETWLYRVNAGYENTRSFRNGYFLQAYQVAPSFSFIPNDKLQVNLDISISHTNSVVDRGQPALNGETGLTSTPINLSVIHPGDYLKETNISTVLSATYTFNKHVSFNTGLLNYMTSQRLSEHGIKNFITNDSANLYYNYRKVNTGTYNFTNYFSFLFNTGQFKHQLLVGYDYIGTDRKSSGWQGELADFGAGNGIVGTFSLRHPQYRARPVNSFTQISDTSGGADIADGEYATHGVYVQEQSSYNKWQVIAGLRAELYQSGDEAKGDVSHVNRLLPRIGVTYAAAKDIRVYASYNSGFDPFEPSTVVQVFNEPYKPVTSAMYETGIKADLLQNKLAASLAVYQITINNLAVNANDANNPNLFVQRGVQRSRGAEVEVQGNFTRDLSVALTYSLNKTEIIKSIKQDEVGRVAENAPRHSSTSWVKYNFSKGWLKGFGLSGGHTQAGKRNTLVSSVTLPGYCVLNGGIHYTANRINIALNINNLFNTSYWSAAYNNTNKWPGAPRNFMLRLGYNF